MCVYRVPKRMQNSLCVLYSELHTDLGSKKNGWMSKQQVHNGYMTIYFPL